jgi:ubiquinol-cytochrome c reductase iron-sulfur subunit
MGESRSDQGRRRFLIGATSVVGAAGGVAAAVPFVMSMLPSERAKAAGAPVEVDISKVEPGMMLSVEWRGQPVWVVNRTKEMMDRLPQNDGFLRDPKSEDSDQPESCKNETRSVAEKSNILVVVGVCTHLGCSPSSRMKAGAAEGMSADWPGGFFCPCHGSKFDLAARVFQGVPAPTNLKIPPYTYLSDARLLIGQEKPKGNG